MKNWNLKKEAKKSSYKSYESLTPVVD